MVGRYAPYSAYTTHYMDTPYSAYTMHYMDTPYNSNQQLPTVSQPSTDVPRLSKSGGPTKVKGELSRTKQKHSELCTNITMILD